MNNILLELQTEELPSSFLLKAQDTLPEIVKSFLDEKKLTCENIDVFITPRRITLLIKGLPSENKKEEIIIVGPPYNACFKDDIPTKALEAFLKKNEADIKDIFKYEKGGGVYIAIKKTIGGEKIEYLFRDFPDFIIKKLPAKKTMRWDNSGVRFPRPIRGVALILNDHPIEPFKNTTFGHRFLSEAFKIKIAERYEELLKEHYVIPRFKERKDTILNLINQKAVELNLNLDYEEDLIDEITNLVEYPYLVVGEFERDFLALPDVVIKTILAHHQKFIVTKKDGIENTFFGISNMPDKHGYIKEGYQKVVRARLRDGVFFYNEDLKKPFEFFVNELKGVMFHHKLGSMLDKTQRHIAIGEYLSDKVDVDKNHLLRACYLSGFDIATGLVKELDELQGYMGMIYAEKKGEPYEVYKALLEQYMPDKIEGKPSTKTGVILGVILKSDNIVSLMSAGEIPKGTSDAYAIKKNIYGLIHLIIENNLSIDLKSLFEKVYGLLEDKSKLLPYEELSKHIESLFKSRLQSFFEEYRYDIVRAVIEVEHPLNMLSIKNKVEILSSYQDMAENIAKVYKRIRKILPEKDYGDIDERFFESELERKLYEFSSYIYGKEFSKELIDYIDKNKNIVNEFFDKILVMAPDLKVRENRLNLVHSLYKSLKTLADFEHIVIKEAL